MEWLRVLLLGILNEPSMSTWLGLLVSSLRLPIHMLWWFLTFGHDSILPHPYLVFDNTQYELPVLTPWSRVLLEQLTGSQLVKKFPAFYGTRKFITAFTSARHLPLSASPIHSIFSHPTSWRSILIYPPIYAWVSQVVSFLHFSTSKPCIRLSSPWYTLDAPPISFFSILSP